MDCSIGFLLPANFFFLPFFSSRQFFLPANFFFLPFFFFPSVSFFPPFSLPPSPKGANSQ